MLYVLDVTPCKHLAFCCFQILTCILTEQRIVFFSSDWALLTLVAECFMLYLHPLQWQHTFVPILSRHMLDFVMAPTSFLMGCHIDHFEEVSTVCSRSCCSVPMCVFPPFFQIHLETWFCYLGVWEVKKLKVIVVLVWPLAYWDKLLVISLTFIFFAHGFWEFLFHLGKISIYMSFVYEWFPFRSLLKELCGMNWIPFPGSWVKRSACTWKYSNGAALIYHGVIYLIKRKPAI